MSTLRHIRECSQHSNQICEQSKCPAISEWTNKCRLSIQWEYRKQQRNSVQAYATTWMNLKSMPTERSQIHKTSSCKLHLCVISRRGKLIDTDQCACLGDGGGSQTELQRGMRAPFTS